MIKKIVILFSFLAIANQIIAQEDEYFYVINKTGHPLFLHFGQPRRPSGYNVNGSGAVQKIKLHNEQFARTVSVRGANGYTEAWMKQICNNNENTIIDHFKRFNLEPNKTYTISIGNCTPGPYYTTILNFNVTS